MVDRPRRCAAVALAAAIGAGFLAAPAAARPKGPDAGLVERLKGSAQGSLELSTKRGTGYFRFVEAGRHGDLLPAVSAGAKTKAEEFLARYGQLLGVEDGSRLVETGSDTDGRGSTHVTYTQTYKGLPVFGAQIRAHVDAAGDLTVVNGVAVPDIDLSVTPRLSADQANARAVAEVAKEGATGLDAVATQLLVYRTGLVRGEEGSNELTYQVEVANGKDVRELVFVHANAGKVLNRYSLMHEAMDREVYEGWSDLVWREGDPFPGSLNASQQDLVSFSGDSYRYFFNAFGRDSYDGTGGKMMAFANAFTRCPNAGWNGTSTIYCNGVTSDDAVGHEWGHAYTQHTHDLIYQWQSGAINEAYSDIWGEVVDVLNGAGTDSPATERTPGTCTDHTVDSAILKINEPAASAGRCTAGEAQFGPRLTVEGVTGDVVHAQDGVSSTDVSTTNGCTAPFANDLTGKVALIDHGQCEYTTKVKNAQEAGAIGVIVGDFYLGTEPMFGSDPTITIPSLLVSLRVRNVLAEQLAAGRRVNTTLGLRGGGQDTYRWLLSEDSYAFYPDQPAGGHAIRDLWDPTCLGDPGKVTDGEYYCTTGNNGGVHTNSGVPNHGFALLVDGGTYNGRTVPAIGLTKAAHVYWRAQSVYQVPTTDFPDHADALEASCRDLIGASLTSLTTSGPPAAAGEKIGTADCAAIAEMAAAVELRTSPHTQCAMLQPGSPAVCAAGEKAKTVYSTTFEDGLDGWTVSNQGKYAGWHGMDWKATSALPEGRPGAAAYAANPNVGSCDGGAGDVSGVMRLTSPLIELPGAMKFTPKLSFAHYVATEEYYDGGNIKISVNGGPFEVGPFEAVSPYAFTFNRYTDQLHWPAPNPLAGQPGWTGTNPGELRGSWGESHVNLGAMGIKPGDSIQVRFDFGTDGCSGVDGWYVDNFAVRTCEPKARRKP